MKIRMSQLRRVIREEVERGFGKAKYSLRVAKAVSIFTEEPNRWKIARDAIADMATGGDAEGVRQQYYPDWSDDEFKQLWLEMGQDMSEIGL